MPITVAVVHPNDVEADELAGVGIAAEGLDGLRALADDRGVMPLPAVGVHSATHFVFYRLTDDGEAGELCRTRFNCSDEQLDDECLGRALVNVAAAATKQKAKAAKRDAARLKLEAEKAAEVATEAEAKAEAAEAVLAASDEGGDSE